MDDYDRWKLESREDEQARISRDSDAAAPAARQPCDTFRPSFYAPSICMRCGRALTMHTEG